MAKFAGTVGDLYDKNAPAVAFKASKDFKGSIDGVTTTFFKAGKTYRVPAKLAEAWSTPAKGEKKEEARGEIVKGKEVAPPTKTQVEARKKRESELKGMERAELERIAQLLKIDPDGEKKGDLIGRILDAELGV